MVITVSHHRVMDELEKFLRYPRREHVEILLPIRMREKISEIGDDVPAVLVFQCCDVE
jgi:hypothetical protein